MSNAKKRIAIIDWMKAFFILMPIISHSELFTIETKETNLMHILICEICVPGFMMLSGYTFAMKNGECNLKEMYEVKGLLKSFVRFTFPMLVAYILYELKQVLYHKFSVTSAIKRLILGKFGEGAYYYAMMIGFLLIAPLVFLLIRRMRFKGVLIIAGINFLYQLACNFVGLPASVYRVLVFRYLTMIALGMYSYFLINSGEKLKISNLTKVLVAIGFCIGFVYKIAPHFGYKYQIFKYSPWGRTSMVTALYFFPVVFLVLYKFHDKNMDGFGRFGKAVELIGKASYHILFAQMVYYVYRPIFDEKIYNLLESDIGFWGGFIEITVDLIISIGVGVLFYLLDSKFITGKLKKI